MGGRGGLEARIRRSTGKAIGDFSLIEEGDKILLALSGGKDSWTLLHILLRLRERAPVSFTIVPVTVHPGFPGFRADVLGEFLARKGLVHHVEGARIYDTIQEKARRGKDGRIRGGDFCSFCSRLRRGVLYRVAGELGCSKIALGHHADDVIETLLLNQLFDGRSGTMAPKFISTDGLNTVIRPLYYVWEEDTRAYARQEGFPVICCRCPVCGDMGMQRRVVKAMLREMEGRHPGIKTSLLSACLSHGRPEPAVAGQ